MNAGNSGENITLRMPSDLLQAVDEEVTRRFSTDETGEPVTRSIVIREALRKQLNARRGLGARADRMVAQLLGAIPTCDAFGCNEHASHMENEMSPSRKTTIKWWCRSHTTKSAIEVELIVEVKAVARAEQPLQMPTQRMQAVSPP